MKHLYRQLKKIEALKRAPVKKMADSKKTTTKTSWWEKVPAFYSTGMKVFFAFLFLLLVVHAAYELFRYDLIIRPFETPFNLTRQEGYSGTVVAYRLQDYMNQKREELKRSSVPGVKGVAAIQLTELQRRPEIDVPAIGLSLNAIIYQLRRMLGIKQRRVSGDIVVREGKLYLTVRITKKPAITFPPGEVKNPEPVIKQAAEYVLKTLEPLTFGLNYCTNNKKELLTSLIKEIQQSQHDEKKALVLTLEGCLFKNLEKYEAAINKLDQALQDESLENDSLRAVILYLKGETLLEEDKPTLAIEEYEKALELYPNNGVIYAQLAEALIKSKKTKKGLEEYEKASKKDPDNPWLYTAWGYQLAELKEFKAADEKFKKAVTVAPNYALAYANWGDVLLKKRDEYRAATEKYEQAVKLDPSVAWVYGNWGVALVKLGEDEKALAKFEKSLDLKSTDWVYNHFEGALRSLKKPELFAQYEGVALKQKRTSSYYKAFEYVLQRVKKPELFAKYEDAVAIKQQRASYYEKWGTVLASLKQYEAAITKYQKALEMNPTEGFYHYKLANALVELGKHESEAGKDEQARLKYEQARVNYEKAVQLKLPKRSLVWAYSGWGEALVGLKRYEEALAKYEEALNLKHRMHALFYNKLMKALRQFDKQEYFAQYQPLIERSKSNILKSRYYYRWGRTVAKLNQHRDAITQYKKALDTNPKHVWSRIMLGHELIQVQESTEALTECETLLELTPASSDNTKAAVHALCGLAQIALNQREAGTKNCQKALELSENEDWAYWCLGDVLVLQNQPEEAVKQYEAAVNVKPENAFYRYKWGQALAQLKQYDAAITQFEKAVELDKDGEIGKQAQAKIEALKDEKSPITDSPLQEPSPDTQKVTPSSTGEEEDS